MAGHLEHLDFDAFHRVELPRRMAAGHAPLAARAARRLKPLALRHSEGGAYTCVPRDGTVGVVEGKGGPPRP